MSPDKKDEVATTGQEEVINEASSPLTDDKVPAGESKQNETADLPFEEQRAVEATKQFARFLEEVAKIKDELEATKKELENSENRYARLQADFDNFKRRTRQEKEELACYASECIVVNLLPVLDNFQRALGAKGSGGAESLLSGIDMIHRQLFDVLVKEGLEPMVSVGEEFDPNRHDAVMYGEANEDFPDGKVMEELQKGYLLKDKVIRPAMVKVAKS